jgi:CTP:molybdopterin cytidylyltransferase MocA
VPPIQGPGPVHQGDAGPRAERVEVTAPGIHGVILAAGAGRRIGGPKALLPLGEGLFLDACIRLLQRHHVTGLLVVLGHQAERVRTAVPEGVDVIVNPAPDEGGMLSSVRLGLEAAQARGADAVLLHPVDHPLVSPATVDRVVDALLGGAIIAVPTVGGRRGHPGGFARASWPALHAAPPETGARAVLAQHPGWVVHVPGDLGCRAGVDTAADYERLIGPRRG